MTLQTRVRKISSSVDGGRAEGLACADPGAREITRENKVFTSRILKFHKLSGYVDLMKGTSYFDIILIFIFILGAVEKRTPPTKNKLSSNKKTGSKSTAPQHVDSLKIHGCSIPLALLLHSRDFVRRVPLYHSLRASRAKAGAATSSSNPHKSPTSKSISMFISNRFKNIAL